MAFASPRSAKVLRNGWRSRPAPETRANANTLSAPSQSATTAVPRDHSDRRRETGHPSRHGSTISSRGRKQQRRCPVAGRARHRVLVTRPDPPGPRRHHRHAGCRAMSASANGFDISAASQSGPGSGPARTLVLPCSRVQGYRKAWATMDIARTSNVTATKITTSCVSRTPKAMPTDRASDAATGSAALTSDAATGGEASKTGTTGGRGRGAGQTGGPSVAIA